MEKLSLLVILISYRSKPNFGYDEKSCFWFENNYFGFFPEPKTTEFRKTDRKCPSLLAKGKSYHQFMSQNGH